MKNKDKYTFFFFLFLPFLLNAQFFTHGCFTDQVHEKMMNENAKYKSKHQEIEQQIYNLKNGLSFISSDLMTSQTIPVVVHIVHQNGLENIPDSQVYDAIQQLNDAFANVDFYNPETGVDTEIEFCLAMRDPQNNPTNGINRINSLLTNVIIETEDLELKELLQWNPLDYLNIWVVNEISSVYAGSAVAGYAYFPAVHGTAEDGIVIEADYMGFSQNDTKVLVHEAGHYLGLYHTFEGGCTNQDCQIDGDRICDTPPDQSIAPVACGESINTCNTDEEDTSENNPFRPVALGGLGDQNDMFINYMDYGNLPCFSAFTAGQKERMHQVLLSPRQSLLESYGCLEPCPLESFSASFTFDASSPVFVGDLLNFTNTSDAANFYEWTIDNQVISNNLNSSYTFDEEGIFAVNLQIRDTINYCEDSFTEIIEVSCEGEASFTTSSTEILPGETISFTNTSTGNNSYQWFLDGIAYSTDTDLSITFEDPGYYTIYLVGETSNCSNYSTTIRILVGACTGVNKREMHWYFGENAALDFNSGEPVFVPNSQLNSLEGSACISDNNGDLLFYTDGLNIWDATNTVMPNGSGLMGGATVSAWDQALVVPRPHHPKQYYVFTYDEFENGAPNPVRYSIVDMELNNGLGDVTDVKNVFLTESFSEAMSATFHADGQNVWLICPDGDVLKTYLIDSIGISLTSEFSDANYDVYWGLTRFFNSGKRLVVSQFDFSSAFLVIFDFNIENGTFSNPAEISTDGTYLWTFELSPDDSKLYVGLGSEDNSFGIHQFDMSLTTAELISNSNTYIGNINNLSRMLLAPNDRIYQTDYYGTYLGVINNPNELGLDSDFVPNFIDLSPASNNTSLPKFIRGYQYYPETAPPIVDLGPDKSICNGLTTVLDPGSGDYEYLWQDGSTDPTFTAWLPGTYRVTVTNECQSVTDSINISLEELDLVDLGMDVNVCDDEVDLNLNAGTEGDFYLWQDGSNGATLSVFELGDYWVQVSTEGGCYQTDSISIELDTQAPIVDCPMNFDTLVSFGTSEVNLNPGLPTVSDDCSFNYLNDFTNTADATANYSAGASTTVTWTITDTNGNSATCEMNVSVEISTGIEDFNQESSIFMLYPNPNNGIFILEGIQEGLGDIQLSVFDALGRKIYDKSSIFEDKMHIDLSQQAAGIYFLHWVAEGNRGVIKLMFE